MYKWDERGFTLLEILAVLAIVGVLAALAVPRFILTTSDAEEEVCEANKATINVQVERYYLANDETYPADIDTLTGDEDYFPDGAPECPSGGTYALDEDTHRATCTEH